MLTRDIPPMFKRIEMIRKIVVLNEENNDLGEPPVDLSKTLILA